MSTPNLAQRLLAVNKALGWVAKNGTAAKEQGGYAFVKVVDILDDVRTALNEHGVVFHHSVTDHRVTVIPREGRGPMYLSEVSGDFAYINADDPTQVQAGSWRGSALDTGDKSLYKAITGGLKYILIPNHLLPTGDDPEAGDGDEEKPAPAKGAPATPPARSAPSSVKEGLTEPQRKKLMATLEGQDIKETESKRFVIKELTGKHSTKQMTTDDLDKILRAAEAGFDDEFKVRALAAAG